MSAQTEALGRAAERAATVPTTSWSLDLRAGAGRPEATLAPLESLCRQYWYPIYAFLRRHGHSHDAAEDLTLGFFAHMLASEGLLTADPARGRFRSYLLTCLRHFTTSTWRHEHAIKRGGAVTFQPLELLDAEGRFAAEPADPGLTPEEVFDRNWALGLIQQAIGDLRAEYERTGRGLLFTELLPFALDREAGESRARAAHRLGVHEHAFTVAISRFRRRLREHLRCRVAGTVESPQEVDDEIRILLAILRTRGALR